MLLCCTVHNYKELNAYYTEPEANEWQVTAPEKKKEKTSQEKNVIKSERRRQGGKEDKWMRPRPPRWRRTRARLIAGVWNRGSGERRRGEDIYRSADKAWCLFPRGAQRLLFLSLSLFFFFKSTSSLNLLSLSLPPSLPLLPPSPSQIELLPAGHREEEPLPTGLSTDCIYSIGNVMWSDCRTTSIRTIQHKCSHVFVRNWQSSFSKLCLSIWPEFDGLNAGFHISTRMEFHFRFHGFMVFRSLALSWWQRCTFNGLL